MNVDLRAEIDWIKSELDRLADPTIVEAVKKLLAERSAEPIEEELGVSVEQYNRELDEAERAYARGEWVSHEEVKASFGRKGKNRPYGFTGFSTQRNH